MILICFPSVCVCVKTLPLIIWLLTIFIPQLHLYSQSRMDVTCLVAHVQHFVFLLLKVLVLQTVHSIQSLHRRWVIFPLHFHKQFMNLFLQDPDEARTASPSHVTAETPRHERVQVTHFQWIWAQRDLVFQSSKCSTGDRYLKRWWSSPCLQGLACSEFFRCTPQNRRQGRRCAWRGGVVTCLSIRGLRAFG